MEYLATGNHYLRYIARKQLSLHNCFLKNNMTFTDEALRKRELYRMILFAPLDKIDAGVPGYSVATDVRALALVCIWGKTEYENRNCASRTSEMIK